jgi:hypothetical protein
VVKKYQSKLTGPYYYKDNSGPGDSGNYGVEKAKGITIIFDSGVLFHRISFGSGYERKLCGLFRRS